MKKLYISVLVIPILLLSCMAPTKRFNTLLSIDIEKNTDKIGVAFYNDKISETISLWQQLSDKIFLVDNIKRSIHIYNDKGEHTRSFSHDVFENRKSVTKITAFGNELFLIVNTKKVSSEGKPISGQDIHKISADGSYLSKISIPSKHSFIIRDWRFSAEGIRLLVQQFYVKDKVDKNRYLICQLKQNKVAKKIELPQTLKFMRMTLADGSREIKLNNIDNMKLFKADEVLAFFFKSNYGFLCRFKETLNDFEPVSRKYDYNWNLSHVYQDNIYLFKTGSEHSFITILDGEGRKTNQFKITTNSKYLKLRAIEFYNGRIKAVFVQKTNLIFGYY